jgi:hydrogenase maturation protein HypF
MACSWLVASDIDPPVEWRQVAQLARSGLASPQTTSMGRLFDAVAALTGVRTTVNYEGQAAIELEARCDPSARGRYPIGVARGLIDPRPTIAAITDDIRRDVGAATIATRFHTTIAHATIEACTRAASEHATEVVVLSGGVFTNRRLLAQVASGLDASGLRVLVPRRLPVNDGGISYGQAAVAAARMAV